MSGTRYFRATFADAAYPEMQITIEFEAPYPLDESIDYSEIALRSIEKKVAVGHIRIRDLEPVEI